MKLGDVHFIRRSDRRVIYFSLTVILAVLAIGYFADDKDMLTEAPEMKKGARTTGRDSVRTYYARHNTVSKSLDDFAVEKRQLELFPFDPNTAKPSELLALGLEPWQVRNICKYRAKGGVYRHKEDFGRVYGLTVKQYRELEPYIRIGSDYQPYADTHKKQSYRYDADTATRTADNAHQLHYTPKLKAGETISINTADTTELKRVPGIGSYFARRIVLQRKRYGGFYSSSQLLEIDNFPKDALPFFSINESEIQRINVNKATLQELKRHPYINYYQARDIVEYRRQRGTIKDISELHLLKDFSEHDLEKIRHYVEY